MTLSRQIKKCGSPGLVLLALAFLSLPGPAAAQGRLEAQYTMTLAGLPIGQGTWVIDLSDRQYSSAATGGTTGLLRTFTGGEGGTTVQGTLQAGKPVQSAYAATIKSSKKTDEIRLTVSNGKVKDLRFRQSAGPGSLPAHFGDLRRPPALRPATGLQAHGPGQGR